MSRASPFRWIALLGLGLTATVASASNEPQATIEIAVLPDLQYLTSYQPLEAPQLFDGLLRRHQHKPLDVVAIVGDLTWNDRPDQYQPVLDGIARLHQAGLPVAVVPGNHDYRGDGRPTTRRETLWHDYFTQELLGKHALSYLSLGGSTENGYWVVNPRSELANPLAVLGFGFSPRLDVLEEGRRLLESTSTHATLLFAHALLEVDGSLFQFNPNNTTTDRTDFPTDGSNLSNEVFAGQADRLIAGICGHRGGCSYELLHGIPVLLRNFQQQGYAGMMKLTHLRIELLPELQRDKPAPHATSFAGHQLEPRARLVSRTVDAPSWALRGDYFQRHLRPDVARRIFPLLGHASR